MDSRAAIRASWQTAEMVTNMYLGDLTDAELLVRSVPGINHIAWQLGHLVQSDHQIIDGVCPGSMPALPAGFAEKHSKETATSDKPGDFLSKSDYLRLFAEQRAAAAVALAKQTDADLDKPAPDSMKDYAPTVGDAFLLLGGHWLMHAGQWAVLRRKLGRPPLF